MQLKIYGDLPYFWQWDLDRKLVVEDDGVCSQVHFCSGSDEAMVCLVRDENSLRVVDVPNILLQKSEPIYAYLYTVAEDGTRTRSNHRFPVIARSRPSEYVYTETEVFNYAYLDKRLNDLEGEGLENAVKEYLAENPVQGGATAEEAAQIQQNKEDINQLSNDKLDASKLPEAVNEALAEAKASGAFDGAKGEKGDTGAQGPKGDKGDPGKDGQPGADGKDYVLTEADKAEIAEQASKLVDIPDVEGAVRYDRVQTLTDEQKAQARANIGANEEWFEIADITSTEEVNSFYVNKDKNGNPFVCKRIVASMVLPSALTSGGAGVYFGGCNAVWSDPGFSANNNREHRARTYDISVTPGFFTEFRIGVNNAKHFGASACLIARGGDGFTDLLTQFFVCRADTAADLYPVGTQLKVWGLKA